MRDVREVQQLVRERKELGEDGEDGVREALEALHGDSSWWWQEGDHTTRARTNGGEMSDRAEERRMEREGAESGRCVQQPTRSAVRRR